MKTKHLFFYLCFGLFCCATNNLFGQHDRYDESRPPKRIHGVELERTANSIVLIFNEESDDVNVDVIDKKGASVCKARGGVRAEGRMEIDVRGWKKGKYQLRIDMRKKHHGKHNKNFNFEIN